MTATLRTILPALPLLLAGKPAPVLAADDAEAGIRVAPGRWLFDVEIRAPLQPEPSVQRLQTCATSEPITASTLMPWARAQGCRIKGVEATEQRLTWKLVCYRDGQRSRGRGEFAVDGDRGSGKAKVSFEVSGRKMSVVTEWDARRVGPCSPAEDGEAVPRPLTGDPQ